MAYKKHYGILELMYNERFCKLSSAFEEPISISQLSKDSHIARNTIDAYNEILKDYIKNDLPKTKGQEFTYNIKFTIDCISKVFKFNKREKAILKKFIMKNAITIFNVKQQTDLREILARTFYWLIGFDISIRNMEIFREYNPDFNPIYNSSNLDSALLYDIELQKLDGKITKEEIADALNIKLAFIKRHKKHLSNISLKIFKTKEENLTKFYLFINEYLPIDRSIIENNTMSV